MSLRKWFGVAVASAVVGGLAGTSGCSSSTSSNNTTPNDASSEGAVIRHPDGSTVDTGTGGSGDDGGDSSGPQFDSTTGKACKTDTDCKGAAPGSPGVNKCTTDVLFSGGELFPSGVCLLPLPCDPCGGMTPCDNLIHGCDGPDGSPSTPGICLPNTNPPAVGKGLCLPACSFKGDGSAPTGCVGKDTCNAIGFDATTSPPTGVGYCWGGCAADTDCATGEKCDTTTGLCLKTVTPPTKALGDGCTMTEANMSPPPCNCVYNPMSGLGFCTEVCTVGGTQCPTGWFCEAQEPTTLTGANDASVAGFTMQNMGLGGFCVPSCTVDGGAMGTDSGTCPPNTTCQNTNAGGPGCIP